MLRTLTGTSGLTFADQVVSSGSNFVVLALVARATGPADYAVFAAALAAWFLVLGVHRAVVVEPMVLDAADEADGAVDRAVARGRSLARGGAVLACLALVALTQVLVMTAPALAGVSACTAVVVPALLLQDQVRWECLARRDAAGALRSDVVFATVEVAAVVGLLLVGRLGVVSGLAAVGLGAAVSVLSAPSPPHRRARRRVRLRAHRRLHRRLDRGQRSRRGSLTTWLLVDFACTWVNGQGTLFVVAALLSAADAGLLRAANDLFGPLRLVQMGLVAVVLPSAAAAFAGGRGSALRRDVLLSAGVPVLGSVAYAAAAVAVGGPVLALVYGSAFDADRLVIAALATTAVLLTVQMSFGAGLKATRDVRALALVRCATTAVSLLLLLLGTVHGGLVGAALALPAGALLRTGALAVLFTTRTAEGARDQPDAPFRPADR